MSITGNIEDILELEAVSDTRYVSKNLSVTPPGARGTFGGEIVAQALLAALHIVPHDFTPCSLHGYFVTAGNSETLLEYQVENIRRGRSFIHQEVRCYQGSRLVYLTVILWCLKKPEGSNRNKTLRHYKKLSKDEMIPRESMKSAAELYQNQTIGTQYFRESQLKTLEMGPIEYFFPFDMFRPEGPKDLVQYYIRIRSPVVTRNKDDDHRNKKGCVDAKNDSRYNYVVLAYLSDLYFLYTVNTFRGHILFERHSDTVSLDHSIYFHDLPKVNDWLFFRIHHPRSVHQRSLVQGEYYDPSTNEILASTTQEGVTLTPYKDNKDFKAKL